MNRVVPILLPLCVLASTAPGVAGDPYAVSGRWSAPFWEGGDDAYDPPSLERAKRFPTAATAIVLPDGRVVYWSALEGSEDGELYIGNDDGTAATENARVRILDLRSGTPQWKIPNLERGSTEKGKDQGRVATKDLFCADQKILYSGEVLTAGGSEWRFDLANDPAGSDLYGDDESRIFDPSTDSFRDVDQMDSQRWYPTLTTLPDGRVLVTGGVTRLLGAPADGGTSWAQVRTNEIFDPLTERWEPAGQTDLSFPLYPRLHLLPDGNVFFGGAGQTWGQFGEAPDEAAWNLQRTYSPASRSWDVGTAARYGARGGATSTLLRLEAPYDKADILIAGGTLLPAPGTWAGTTLSDVVRWEGGRTRSLGEPASPFAGLAGDATQLRNRRWFGTSVMLPTGEVLLMNGGDVDDTWDPGATAAVRTPELYDPTTNTWRELAAGGRDRVYHSSAVLLPDGRVLVGGHAPHPAHYTRHDNPLTRSNNFKDATFEIFEPPYLFRGDRPVIGSFDVSPDAVVLDASGASEVVLVRMGAVTHGQDSDMRAVVLEHTVGDDGSITARLPRNGDGAIVPPGAYFVFANSADGVPSIARTVLVQPDPATGRVVFATA